MAQEVEITVLGAGPAAIAAACALHRLGHDVLLLGVSRSVALEGVSDRALTLLREYGLDAAADSVRGPGERLGSWAGRERSGTECIVQRADLDRALLTDAIAAGVPAHPERVIRCESLETGWNVWTERRQVRCQVVIDARGRRAQRVPCKGPRLIAVCQHFHAPRPDKVFTLITAIPQGWCWLASDGHGVRYLQVTSSGTEPSLRLGLEHHVRQLLLVAPEAVSGLAEAVPVGIPFVRAATSMLSAPSAQSGLIRIGDASVALDALSGQGLYEALRSITAVVAAVRGYLAGNSSAVHRFMEERSRELWQRNAATAALHYRQQARSTASEFWTQAAARYESISSPYPTCHVPRIERRPVLNGSMIELRRVVVTPSFPRGVWKLGTVDVPELLDFLNGARTSNLGLAAQHLRCPAAAIVRALQWLNEQSLLSPAQRVGIDSLFRPIQAR